MAKKFNFNGELYENNSSVFSDYDIATILYYDILYPSNVNKNLSVGNLTYTLKSDGTYELSGIGSYSGTKLFIPNYYNGHKVTSIADAVFRNNTSLTEVTIPGDITTIGSSVFRSCTGLTTVYIQEGVTTMSNNMFYECTSLTTIILPDSLTTISQNAFRNAKITSITISKNVTSIGEGAFSYCNGLTSITISNSVTSIGNSAFSGCSALTTVNYTGTKSQWNSISIGSSNTYLTNAKIICTDGIING